MQPKSTEAPLLSSSVKRPDREIVHKICFLSAAMIVQCLGLSSYFKIPSFLPLYPPTPRPTIQPMLPLLQKASEEKSRCKDSQDHWYFMEGGVKIRRVGFLLDEATIALMHPNPGTRKSSRKNREKGSFVG